jgi:hypothetical protein
VRGRTLLVAILATGLLGVPASQALQPRATDAAHRRAGKPTGAVKLRTPALQSPGNGARVQALPTFGWNAVAKATAYQFQLSADKRFRSQVKGAGGGASGTIETPNTAATIDKAVPDGTYYWRVRAVAGKATAGKQSAGRWSPTRKLTKLWTSAPQLGEPIGTALSWPSQPLVFSWTSVPYAVKYQLTVATDPSLANQVIGTKTRPITTESTFYSPPAALDSGTYFWAVTPLDAEGHPGPQSQIAPFTYTWPSTTTTNVTDLNPDPRVFDPLFSWSPVAGAARYEVEVNSAEGFPPGSKWCCTGTTIGTSLAPTKVLANNRYYWRVRAIDAKGHAGVWNEGASFTKQFDSVQPSIPNLTVRDASGNALGGIPSTDTPIVTWDPVPGASRYEVQLVPNGGLGCDWSKVAANKSVYEAETATTAWTPLATGPHIGPTAWPKPQVTGALATGQEYCFRVLARSDDDAQGNQVVSNWTQINGLEEPAFTYAPPEAAGTPVDPFVTPEGNYLQPLHGQLTPRTPYFTWQRVTGAEGYYVVIARDAAFTEIADVGYTNVPAYAPRLANEAPLSDETTAYYWAVLPTAGANGQEETSDPERDHPQSFNKSSAPPSPLAPGNGATVSNQPTFEWTGAENARNYRIQVSQDPSFGHPLEDVTTDATAYTSSTTYPADTVLYWRVHADDWIGHGLNWSPVQSFVRTLPAPDASSGSPRGGESIPVLKWSPVQGAVGYEVHVLKVSGASSTATFPAAAATPTEWYGVGVWRWQVRADFPGATQGQTITGGYSALQEFVRTLNAPAGVRAVKKGMRLVISWNPDPAAKRYEVQLSTSDSFSRTIETHQTDNASWAPPAKLTAAQRRGALFWRVAAVDAAGNVGSFASGRFGAAHASCTAHGKGSNARGSKKPLRCAKRRTARKH